MYLTRVTREQSPLFFFLFLSCDLFSFLIIFYFGLELALMALDCAERDTTHLQNDTFGLLQNATGELKEALDQCSGNSFLAQQEYSPVRGYVQQGDYKSAADVITGDIIPYVASCLQAFDQAPDLPVPPLVLAGTLASNQTAKIAASILTNI